MHDPRLTLILTNKYGSEEETVCVNLDWEPDILQIKPPCEITGTCDEFLVKVEKKNYRTENFEKIGRVLGKLMAQRLEDKEGWHGENRKKLLNKDV